MEPELRSSSPEATERLAGLLAAELVRVGADFTFLRRSFTADMAGRDPVVEVPRLLDVLTGLATATAADVAERLAAFVAAVTGVPVAQPA